MAALCALSSVATAHDPPEAADLALRNGAVYTVDGARSWAQAVAIRGGRIVYVGTDAGIASLVGARTRVVDLRGRMLLPGFQDVHIHPISGGIQANSCDLSGAKAIE
jgi:predicted amidohydrolase YtcJ